MSGQKEADLREKLADTARRLYNDRLTSGTSGNISARIPDSNNCLIKPSGFSFSNLNPDDFIVVDINSGDIVQGEYGPSIETPFHTKIYKHRARVGCVLHIHAKYSTIISIVANEFVPMGMEIYKAPALAKGVKISGFATPGSTELAEEVFEAVKNKVACLLPHHGSVTIGKTVSEAEQNARVLERLARLQYNVMLIGELKPFTEQFLDEIKSIAKEKDYLT